jgi:hypothetical protein
MRLSGSGHGSEDDGHAPVDVGGLGPFPFAEALGRVVDFVVAEVVVCVFDYCD